MNAVTTTTTTPVHPVIRHADGRRTQRGELSFFTRELNRLGNCTAWNYFDVPEEEYSDGLVTGYRCAAELLAALERGNRPFIDVGMVMRDAIKADSDPSGKPGRRGASAAFMEVMAQAVTFMAKHANNALWLAGKIEKAEKQRDAWAARKAAHKAEQRAEFSARMKAARQAKRTQQAEEVAA